MDQLRGQLEDGAIVPVIRIAPALPLHAQAPDLPHFAIHNGEQLIPHPDDRDGTLFLTYRTKKLVRLIAGTTQ